MCYNLDYYSVYRCIYRILLQHNTDIQKITMCCMLKQEIINYILSGKITEGVNEYVIMPCVEKCIIYV